MVRLAARSFLHMLPEEVDKGFDHPFYEKVLRINDDIMTFRSLGGGKGVVSRNVALQHVVSARKVQDSMTVDSNGHQYVLPTSQPSPVPPIVALLFQHVEVNLNGWNHGYLEKLQVTIMNRVLGRNGGTASNAFEDAMHGVMDKEIFPASSWLCRWINPGSGRPTEFPLQHAQGYVYFVASGRSGSV
ncbi:Hypothetical protein PHPALM_19631 [Phytophthora palmivora]|uniref:Uncharacterized protein n=1 Tax=Phytophthora palmivora TaxID=4796 RepID=A0A2P4XGY7_9STRA|nr:Hypothetical protein PHPALM_19631 [Phytophthora palmivora]